MLERILVKHGDNIFIAFMVLGIVPIFMFQFEFNKPFIFGFKFLSIPIVFITFAIYWFAMPNWKEENSLLKGLLMSSIVAGLVTLMSGSYVIGINAWAGSQTPIDISGEIIDLEISKGSKSTSYLVTIANEAGEEKKLDVSFEVFSSLEVGEFYKDVWQKGSLGLIYRRK